MRAKGELPVLDKNIKNTASPDAEKSCCSSNPLRNIVVKKKEWVEKFKMKFKKSKQIDKESLDRFEGEGGPAKDINK